MNNQDDELDGILDRCDLASRRSDIKAAILAWHNKQLHELDKSYGGCHSCYGKGYSTVKSQITGYGTDGDIGGFEGPLKVDKPIEIKYCDCDRGKQLEQVVIEARIDELTELSRRFWQLSVPERAILGRIRVLINEQEEAQSKG